MSTRHGPRHPPSRDQAATAPTSAAPSPSAPSAASPRPAGAVRAERRCGVRRPRLLARHDDPAVLVGASAPASPSPASTARVIARGELAQPRARDDRHSSSTWPPCATRPTDPCPARRTPVPAQIGRDARRATRRRAGAWSPTPSTGTSSTTARAHLPARTAAHLRPGPRRRLPQPPAATTAAPAPADGPRHPFPDGPSTAANTGAALHRRPPAQDRRLRRPSRTASPTDPATWVTAWGQRIHIPPRPFLHDPADIADPDPPPPLDEPPF